MGNNVKPVDIMLIRLVSGEIIAVTAPVGTGGSGGAVLTSTGHLGQIVKCYSDYTGSVLEMFKLVMTIHTAKRVMLTCWEADNDREVVADA